MKRTITIDSNIEKKLQRHFFQSELEQGAFLFTEVKQTTNEVILNVKDYYLIPEDGWQVQLDVYLEMKDSERSKIMSIARKGGYGVIDCHSHPGSDNEVQFSPSDCHGITDFAAYTNWKLGGKPFAAIVWGEASFDAVVWMTDFKKALPLDELRISGDRNLILKPEGSWFIRKPTSWWSSGQYGK